MIPHEASACVSRGSGTVTAKATPAPCQTAGIRSLLPLVAHVCADDCFCACALILEVVPCTFRSVVQFPRRLCRELRVQLLRGLHWRGLFAAELPVGHRVVG